MSTPFNDQWVLERRQVAESRDTAPPEDAQAAAQRTQHTKAWRRERIPGVFFGPRRLRWIDRDT
jgi:hypothetical protein